MVKDGGGYAWKTAFQYMTGKFEFSFLLMDLTVGIFLFLYAVYAFQMSHGSANLAFAGRKHVGRQH